MRPSWHGQTPARRARGPDRAAHPARPAEPEGGRPRIGARARPLGILFVLKTGMPWGDLSNEFGCGSGSGVTCWRRLRKWQQAGVWGAFLLVLLDELGAAGEVDGARASGDGTVPASGGAPRSTRTPPTAESWVASAT